MVRTRQVGDLSVGVCAQLFGESFSGYAMPVRMTAKDFATKVEIEQVDLTASLVLEDDQGLCGIALLALSSAAAGPRHAWVAGMGVVPRRRRQGCARHMMNDLCERARGLGADRLTLEVLEKNAAARALYLECGFRDVRQLVSFSRPAGECPPSDSPRYAIKSDLSWLENDELRTLDAPCWQRSQETLTRRIRLRSAAGLVVEQEGNPIAGLVWEQHVGRRVLGHYRSRSLSDVAAVGALIRAIPNNEALALSNEPEGTPFAAMLSSLGFTETVRQFEMVATLV